MAISPCMLHSFVFDLIKNWFPWTSIPVYLPSYVDNIEWLYKNHYLNVCSQYKEIIMASLICCDLVKFSCTQSRFTVSSIAKDRNYFKLHIWLYLSYLMIFELLMCVKSLIPSLFHAAMTMWRYLTESWTLTLDLEDSVAAR